MTLRNERGVAFGTANTAALDAYNAAADGFHAFSGDPIALADQAIAQDPGFVAPYALKALLYAMATEGHLTQAAKRQIAKAEAHLAHASETERAHLAAAQAWVDGDWPRAGRILGEATAERPLDLVALQSGHLMDFYQGRSTSLRDRIRAAYPAWSADTPGVGFVHGMLAFGHEESGDYPVAEEHGRKAVGLNPRDSWAVHAVAHVMEMQGRAREGVGWFTSRTADWSDDNFFAVHNWWHLSLFHLDLGQDTEVLRLYDERLREGDSAVMLDLIDASAMLWRLHLLGIDLGERPSAIADHFAKVLEDREYSFNDAHAAMALVAAGRLEEAQRLLALAEERAEAAADTHARMLKAAGLPVLRGLAAFGAGDYGAAADHLAPVRERLAAFGGSHAQRDVFQLTLLEALSRAGRHEEAEAVAAARTADKPQGGLNWRMRAQVAERAGKADAAAKARERAAAIAAG